MALFARNTVGPIYADANDPCSTSKIFFSYFNNEEFDSVELNAVCVTLLEFIFHYFHFKSNLAYNY